MIEPGMARRGFALLVVVVVLAVMGVMAATAHVVGMDRLRRAWAFRESSGALYAGEAGLETGLAAWDTSVLNTLAPGATMALTAGRLSSGDRYRVEVTRLDDGAGRAGYYALESVGRSRGAWRGRRALVMFVKVTRPAVSMPSSGAGVAGRSGAAGGAMSGLGVGPAELHLPHPLAQFRWLQILE